MWFCRYHALELRKVSDEKQTVGCYEKNLNSGTQVNLDNTNYIYLATIWGNKNVLGVMFVKACYSSNWGKNLVL